MSRVELRSVRKSYAGIDAVRHVDLGIEDGEFFTILGASGSGKTTCLRIIAGFVAPSAGCVLIDGKDVTGTPCYRRNVGMVFQNYALFPHLTVAKNVAFGLKARGLPRDEIARRVADALALVQLTSFAERYPRELSGGQQQRVALARAVAIKPDVLLLDEPLSALDRRLRHELRIGIRSVQRRLKLTTLLVTHDQGEALSMSDRIAIMSQGEILQVDQPALVYRRPHNLAVAKFVGRINLFRCEIVKADGASYRVKLREGDANTYEVPARPGDSFKIGDPCLLGVRPEDVVVSPRSHGTVQVRVEAKDYFGDGWFVEGAMQSGDKVVIQMASREAIPDTDAEVAVAWLPSVSFLLADKDH